MSSSEWVGAPYQRHDSKEVVLVRHAQSAANAENVWNGRTDGLLSESGEASLGPLAQRLARWDFDVVLSSPLGRAMQTARSFATEVVTEEGFIEIDLGDWEGMVFTEVQERHGEELAEAISSRKLPLGGTGETLEDVASRAHLAVDDLFERLQPGQRAAVITHGGLIQSVMHRHLRGKGRRVHAFAANTSITRIIHQYGRPRLATFNDVGHLGSRPQTVDAHLVSGDPVLALVRHGQTRANMERRWQGHGDWDLDELGQRQAEALGEWYGVVETVYSSPLKRAWSTAERIAKDGITSVADLRELNMGEWEGLTTEDIAERWPGVMETIYRDGVDLRRGEIGETWGELSTRFAAAVAGLDTSQTGPTGVVSHGGAIRAYVSWITETTDAHAESLYTPANTSVTHVALTEKGPEIIDYAVATHLEAIQ
jgi:broad specificity phosphatase PhoE